MTITYKVDGNVTNNSKIKILNLLDTVEYSIELDDYIAAEVTIHKLSALSHQMDADCLERYEELQYHIDTEAYYECIGTANKQRYSIYTKGR